jgi:uncharacterized protein YndB with AHSA1/START domain
MRIDPVRHLAAVTRAVRGSRRDGRLVDEVAATRDYPAAPGDVWEAVTNPTRLSRWFLPVSGELRPGGRYALRGNAAGTIVRCDPPARLDLVWESRGQVSWVAVTLSAVAGGGTRLELQHATPAGDETWETYGPGAIGLGWELALMSLALHLETDADVDAAAIAAWSAAPDGQAFVRQSSAAWSDAWIASGADPARARRAARKTSAFYTGEDGPGEGD